MYLIEIVFIFILSIPGWLWEGSDEMGNMWLYIVNPSDVSLFRFASAGQCDVNSWGVDQLTKGGGVLSKAMRAVDMTAL